MSANCSMCGHEVRAVSGDEGTSHYEPVERSAGAAPPEPITDTSVLAIPNLTAEEVEAFDAAMALKPPERSAGAAPIDVERLAEALWQDYRRRRPSGRDPLAFFRERAKLIAAEYARLSEGTDR